MPLRYSRATVSNAVPGLSPGISHLTCSSAYTPFTPSKSGQRLQPTYYRGCWHVVSRCFFSRYRHVLRPWSHCPIFPTAASRRSLGRISVPMWPFILSDRLLIVDLVGRYPTNYLIRREAIFQHIKLWFPVHADRKHYAVLAVVSNCCPPLKGRFLTRYSPVRH